MIEREGKRIHDEVHPHHKGHDHGHSESEMAVFNWLRGKYLYHWN
jgi:hypothetical protein